MSTSVTTELTLGPLSADERAAIMQHAPTLTHSARRTFRRLLILAQDRGLTQESIARAAAQAQEHAAG